MSEWSNKVLSRNIQLGCQSVANFIKFSQTNIKKSKILGIPNLLLFFFTSFGGC